MREGWVDLSASTLGVGLMLATHEFEPGVTRVSATELGKECGLSRRQTQEQLRLLRQAGLLAIGADAHGGDPKVPAVRLLTVAEREGRVIAMRRAAAP
jgi:hypothetical protein